MTVITWATADALDALALSIFDPHTDLAIGTVPGTDTGLKAPDAATDQLYYDLIAPVMLAIDGRVMATGFRYTLNITNALQGRPKHWYLAGVMEYNTSNPGISALWPANTGMEFQPDKPFGVAGGTNSFGYTIGLSTCACILHAWAMIVRMWLSNNYPVAIAPPPA